MAEREDPADLRFAEVAVDAPVAHSRTFSYSIPPSLDIRPGQLVDVPFGPRRLQGLVFSLRPHPQVPETRDILSTSDVVPVLTDAQLRLASWLSSYYMCPLFEAAALMLPPGGRVRHRNYLTLVSNAVDVEEKPLTPAQTRILAYIRERKVVEEDRLFVALGSRVKTALDRLVERGLVLRSHRRVGPAVGRKYREYVRLAPTTGHQETRELLPKIARRAPRQAALLAHLLDDAEPLVLAEARNQYGAGAVNALLARGWIEKQVILVDRDPLAGLSFPPTSPVTLTPSQERVATEVHAALDDATVSPRSFLLEGVTGSGKTEIYLSAVQHCLQLRKRAIVLVPELALTHQTVQRFASRFPRRVAVLHSGLSPGQRFDQWWKIRRGEYGVVIGSRSAIFAPQPELGLVVIDEEHEWTYKQHDTSPRYHARDVALRLADLTGSVVVLGSASPDIESYNKALKGGHRLLRLPHRVVQSGRPESLRVDNSGLASVDVVDMRRELREGNRLIFSRALLDAMGQCLGAGSQAVLFLNRRGSAPHMQCRSCGFVLRCGRCDIAMVYHKDVGRLLCHYCGERRIPPTKCPRCLRYRMALYGIGTQTVVTELSRIYPGTEILRWDRDSARSLHDHQSLLERFRSRDAQVLVGTQMIAKGLHFPSVTLVGVVLADVGLNVPDYRAGERAFQLLSQVAGRAGRGPLAGKVILQTYQPENYAIRSAATQDYPRFFREEIAYRREHGNPPFGKLIRLLYTHTNRALCEREALRLAMLLKQQRDSWGYSDIDILGPVPAYLARLRGQYRWQIVLRGGDPRMLLDKVNVPLAWVVDVAPVGLT